MANGIIFEARYNIIIYITSHHQTNQYFTNYGFNTGFMKFRLLKKELILIFLLCKYNLVPSSTTMELYGKDAVMLAWIMHGSPFDFVKIMHSVVLQYKYQTKDDLRHLWSIKLVFILPSLIVCIFFEYIVTTVPSNTSAHRMKPLYDIIVQWSLSSCPQEVIQSNLVVRYAEMITTTLSVTQFACEHEQEQGQVGPIAPLPHSYGSH